MTSASNPLMDLGGIPDFSAISPEHVEAAITDLVSQSGRALEYVCGDQVPAEYDAMSRELDMVVEKLGGAWGLVSHLHAVTDTPAWRDAYSKAQPQVTRFYTQLGSDARLLAKYQQILTQGSNLSAERRKVLSNAIRGFKMSGAGLVGDTKLRFAAIQQRLSRLSQDFSNQLLDATDSYAYWATEDELEGVPADVKAAARLRAEAAGKPGFKLVLQMPCYSPVMQFAKNRALRETLYHAFVTRASDLGPAERDNTPVMKEILALRHERAALLGFRDHAEVSLVPKMADSAPQVLSFLQDLARRATPQGLVDLEQLQAHAKDALGMATLEAWDMAFASEHLRQAQFAFSAQEVKQHFQFDKVLDGLLRMAEQLFELAIEPVPISTWHPAVKAYAVHQRGQLLGHFYLDPFAREGKRGGAWMNGACPRWLRPDGEVRTAQAYLICNFAAPVGDHDALLPHDEVVTLFHEFAHGLHFLLSRVNELGVSGISGVEWDAVELPSQLMENFCWTWEVLQKISAHAQTSAPLPRELYDKMSTAKNFQSGLHVLRQVEMGLFDMRLHARPAQEVDVQAVLDQVRQEVALVRPPGFDRFAHAFAHVFAGGYAAGYYSYLWAEVLSADAWSAFEERGILDPAAWRSFSNAVLEVGGSQTMSENFERFRGRAPTLDALLRHHGMAVA